MLRKIYVAGINTRRLAAAAYNVPILISINLSFS